MFRGRKQLKRDLNMEIPFTVVGGELLSGQCALRGHSWHWSVCTAWPLVALCPRGLLYRGLQISPFLGLRYNTNVDQEKTFRNALPLGIATASGHTDLGLGSLAQSRAAGSHVVSTVHGPYCVVFVQGGPGLGPHRLGQQRNWSSITCTGLRSQEWWPF